jgi:hypothetical protein
MNIPATLDTYHTHVEFEHAFRNRLKQYSDYLRKEINDDGDPQENMRVSYRFEYDSWDSASGVWNINTWDNDTPDINTKGAVFAEVVQAHVRRVREQMDLATLPALLEGSKTLSLPDADDIVRQEIGTYE